MPDELVVGASMSVSRAAAGPASAEADPQSLLLSQHLVIEHGDGRNLTMECAACPVSRLRSSRI